MKIPTYTGSPDVGGPVPTPSFSLRSDEAGGGQGLMALGHGMQVLGSNLSEIEHRNNVEAKRKSDEDSRLWALNRMSQLRLDSMKRYQEALDNIPEGGGNFTSDIDSMYKDSIKSALEEAPTPHAKALLEAHGYEFANTLMTHAMTAQAQERARYRIKSTEDSINRDAEILNRDPTQLDSMAAERIKGLELLRPNERRAGQTLLSKEFFKSYASALIRTDPKTFVQNLDDGKITDRFKKIGLDVDPDLARQFRNLAETKAGARDAMLANQLDDLMKSDITSLISTGERVNNTALQNKEVFIAAFGKDQGPVKFSEFNQAIARAQKVFTFLDRTNMRPLAEVQAALKEIQPVPGSPTFNEENQVYEAVVKEVVRRQNMMHDDPFQAVSETLNKADNFRAGVDMSGAYTNDPNKTTQVATGDYARMALGVELQARAGVPLERRRVLTNAQAKDLVQELNGTAPDQVQKKLDSLEQQYGAYYPMLYKHLVDQRLKTDFALVPWSANTVSGNVIVDAIKTDFSDAVKVSGLQEPDVKRVKEAVDSATREFAKVVATGGISSSRASYLSSLNDVLTKAVLMRVGSMNRNVGDVSAAVKDVVDPLIKDRYDMFDTYYIPKRLGERLGDPNSGVTIDSSMVRRQLDFLKSKEALTRFAPRALGSKNFAITEGALREGVLDASISNGYWVTNETGDGVYYALTVAGARGLPIRDSKGQRYEFKFIDLVRPNVRSGKIGPASN